MCVCPHKKAVGTEEGASGEQRQSAMTKYITKYPSSYAHLLVLGEETYRRQPQTCYNYKTKHKQSETIL